MAQLGSQEPCCGRADDEWGVNLGLRKVRSSSALLGPHPLDAEDFWPGLGLLSPVPTNGGGGSVPCLYRLAADYGASYVVSVLGVV